MDHCEGGVYILTFRRLQGKKAGGAGTDHLSRKVVVVVEAMSSGVKPWLSIDPWVEPSGFINLDNPCPRQLIILPFLIIDKGFIHFLSLKF